MKRTHADIAEDLAIVETEQEAACTTVSLLEFRKAACRSATAWKDIAVAATGDQCDLAAECSCRKSADMGSTPCATWYALKRLTTLDGNAYTLCSYCCEVGGKSKLMVNCKHTAPRVRIDPRMFEPAIATALVAGTALAGGGGGDGQPS